MFEKFCRLCCLKSNDDKVFIFDKFCNSTIAEILTKHFWFEIHKNDGLMEWLCQSCWLQTKTFHEFYTQIELSQKCFYESMKGNDEKDKDCTINTDLLDEKRSTVDTDSSDAELTHDLKSEVILKCKEIEMKVDPVDAVNSDVEGNISENNKQSTKIEQKGDIQDMTWSRGLTSLKKIELEGQIREFFNMKCEMCDDVEFETLQQVRRHYRKVHQTRGYITCCGRKFVLRDNIVEHVFNHINPDAYRCEQCNKSFKTYRILNVHMDSHIPLDLREFKCSLCSSSFNSEIRLKHHVLQKHTSKTGEKFPCDKCAKNFRSKNLLNSHTRQVHDSTQDFVCEVCARSFKSIQNLQNHASVEHATTPPPKDQCHICGVWVKYLKKHRKLHEESKRLNCPICKKETRNQRSLKLHISFVHGEKRHKCSLCDKVFNRASMLKEHVAIHTGEDLYNCTYCDKTFKSNANMYSHRKKAHLTEWTRDFSKPVAPTK